jgi:hypothetical protein
MTPLPSAPHLHPTCHDMRRCSGQTRPTAAVPASAHVSGSCRFDTHDLGPWGSPIEAKLHVTRELAGRSSALTAALET